MPKLIRFPQILWGVFLVICGALPSLAQTDTLSANPILVAPVENILLLSPEKYEGSIIVSASREAESIFKAPMAISVITRQEIEQAGCLSIMEALRLLPGVLVRETTNGNYDINMRGLNNTPPGTDLITADNSNSLVMIDYRPVFNYFSGGTFWENLPIDIHDIDRIELVRGPASALYGANAVTGVIHIITRKIQKEDFFVAGQAEYGNLQTQRAAFTAGYAPNNRFQFLASFNQTRRYRSTRLFYNYVNQEYNDGLNQPNYQVPEVQTNDVFTRAYPRPEVSIDRYGINTFITWNPVKEVFLEFSAGLEDSYALRTFSEGGYSPLTTSVSKSAYLDTKARLKNGFIQLSHWFGEQEPGLDGVGNHYIFNNTDLQLYYDFKIKNLRIRPGFNLRDAVYDDRRFFSNTDPNRETGLLNGRKNIRNYGPSLLFDYTWKKFRWLAAGRYERFSTPERGYFAYQFVFNYQPAQKHLLRLSYSRANRGSFITDALGDYRTGTRETGFPGVFTFTQAQGNSNLELFSANCLEAGYRFQIANQLYLDLEAYWMKAQDYNTLVLQVDTLLSPSAITFVPTFEQRNIPAITSLWGGTFSLTYQPNSQLTFRLFATLQKTQIDRFSPFYFDPELDPSGQRNYLSTQSLDDFAGSPHFYGGFLANYSVGKFNFNLNAYSFSAHELFHISDAILGRPPTLAQIPNKVLLNAKVMFRPYKPLALYINVRNLLFQDDFEYIFTDPVPTTLLGGLSFEF